MESKINNYKCPNCTAALRLSTDSGRLECQHCGSSFEAEYVETLYKEEESLSWDTSMLKTDWDGDGMVQYSCPSCGAELLCSKNTAATFCPYCGNHAIVQRNFEAQYKPDYIIPFKLDKQDALAKLNGFFKDRYFIPARFKKEATLEKVRGIYLPFWLFDGRAWGRLEYDAKLTVEKSNYQGDVTIIRSYNVRRGGNMEFEKVPVDASSNIPDEYMDSIEPYDYSGLKKFSAGYLPGFFADKCDVSIEDCEKKAMERCKFSFEIEMGDSLSQYDEHYLLKSDINVRKGQVHYALFPVWLLTVKWFGKRYFYAINGQTGKITGTVPTVYAKAAGLFLAISGVLTAIGSALTWLIVH